MASDSDLNESNVEVKEEEKKDNVGTDADKRTDESTNQRKRKHKQSHLKRKESKKGKNSQRNAFNILNCQSDISENVSFKDFNLDERLLKAIGELGWEKPTHVQQNMIELALEDKNILARARTGSGKTGAFMIPVVQKILHLIEASCDSSLTGPFALFIAPTRELATQIFKVLVQLISPFPFLQSINLCDFDASQQTDYLKQQLDIIVTTPSRLLSALNHKSDLCANLRHIVVDEADLLVSFGYEDDIKKLKEYLPQSYQSIFTSATLSEDIGPLKEAFLRGSLVTLKLKESELPGSEQLSQYLVNCQNEEQKFAILIAMIKLKLLIGKSILFVSGPDRCYQVGLFLEAFKIRSCIVNAEMPYNSRCHVVNEFNEGRYNYIIASDLNDVFANDSSQQNDSNDTAVKVHQKKEKRKRKKWDKESGVSRGIDFHHVSNVINFDFPTAIDSYIHRVGRTARGWNKGTALSFAIPSEKQFVDEISEYINEMGSVIMPYEIRIKELESFVLRAREVLAACTRSVIREARLAEIKGEILRSKKLDSYFAKNPREKATLEQDKRLHSLSLHSPAIADVPDYMVPPALRGPNYNDDAKNGARRKRRGTQSLKNAVNKKRITAAQLKHKRVAEDPLQSFSV